uniref:uncharacterized protein LOC108111749 n=1 Tax=Drosophila eugracilis TaxID=29029 RepID=UPI0007E6B47C|nr:uncharacterized protein LOC108111749 [Drosophila eugracilis]
MNRKRTCCPPPIRIDEAPSHATAMKKCVIACSPIGYPSTFCCSAWLRFYSSFAY